MRQSSRSAHQRGGDAEHVKHPLASVSVFREPQFRVQSIELGKQGHGIRIALGKVADQPELRNDVAGQQHGNKHGGNRIGKHHHAVLRHLRVGDSFHPTQSGVKEDNARPDDHT